MTTHHYCNSDGEHVYSRDGALVAVVAPERDHYLLRRVLARRELEPRRYASFETADLAALNFAARAAPAPGDLGSPAGTTGPVVAFGRTGRSKRPGGRRRRPQRRPGPSGVRASAA